MRFSIAALSLAAVALATPTKRAVSQSVYNDLLKFYKYSTSAYSDSCPKPLGQTLLGTFKDATTDTQGYVAQDNTNRQIVVAFRGTSSQQDFTTDFNFEPIAYTATGATAGSDVLVHRGFLGAYNSVSSQVIALVKKGSSTYSIVVTGHSLGAGIASVAIPSISGSFRGRALSLYTYGQPRTGNKAYATLIDRTLGSKSFRVVHRFDSVPVFLPTSLGFSHHGVEYYQNQEPASPSAFKVCSGDEDASCSAANPSKTFLNQDHLSYFNIFAFNAYCS